LHGYQQLERRQGLRHVCQYLECDQNSLHWGQTAASASACLCCAVTTNDFLP
jgi:hypothetical protein